ncbi:MAG: hypothetical protein ABW019_13870, partial [Chitinophagaceae bacterium]
NSMQTQQRKIPIRGVNGTFKTWTEVLVPFEKELDHFKHKIDSLQHAVPVAAPPTVLLVNAPVQPELTAARYTIDTAASLFSDTASVLVAFAKELKGLQGVRLPVQQQVKEGTTIGFTASGPIKLLVGFFNSKEAFFSKAPELETNASANDYGQAEIRIANAMVIKGWPPVNIHSYWFGPGRHELKLAKGACLVLGFVKGDQAIPLYDAGLTETGIRNEIDWLFE